MRLFVLVVMLLAAVNAPAADGVMGDWVSGSRSVVRVYACGTDVCLKVVRLPPNPPSLVDVKNPDTKLRGRAICGLDIGTGFRRVDAAHLEGGWLYDPQSGKTYRGTIAVSGDVMSLRGYVGIPLFGRSETWKRVGGVVGCGSL